MSFPESIPSLRSSTELDCSATVAARSSILLNEFYLLEAVGTNDQSSVAGATSWTHLSALLRRPVLTQRPLTNEVMTGISDDQTEVVLPCEVDTRLDMLLGMSVDYIDTIVAEGARAGRIVGRETL